LPKDDKTIEHWSWTRKFEDGKLGYVVTLIYFDGRIKYSEFTFPKLENGQCPERNVCYFDSVEHVINDVE